MDVRQECDICSGMCCNLLSFTIDIVIIGRPVDMHVILNFLKNEGNLHCLGTTLLRIPTCVQLDPNFFFYSSSYFVNFCASQT